MTEIVATGGITLQYFIFNEKLTLIDDFLSILSIYRRFYLKTSAPNDYLITN